MAARVDRFRQICLDLPEAEERETWGHPTFRVRDKIFASCAEDASTVGFKAHRDELDALLSDDRFERAAYVGRYGWVTMTLRGRIAWAEVDELVRSSYLQIAPRRLAKLVESRDRLYQQLTLPYVGLPSLRRATAPSRLPELRRRL